MNEKIYAQAIANPKAVFLFQNMRFSLLTLTFIVLNTAGGRLKTVLHNNSGTATSPPHHNGNRPKRYFPFGNRTFYLNFHTQTGISQRRSRIHYQRH